MDPQNVSQEINSGPLLGLFLLIGMACWCWCGRGPLFLRWPLTVLILLMTSGHALGGMVAELVGALAGPILLFLIIIAGFVVMLRGIGWRSRPNANYHSRHGRGWHERR